MEVVDGGRFGGGDGLRRCSFCGRREESVVHLVRARGRAYICDGCVDQASQAVASAAPGQKVLRIRPARVQVPDQEAAEEAIERAFETVFDSAAPVTDRCAAIDGGANLARAMRELAERYPPADVAVDHVRFLSDDEAEVHFVVLAAPLGPSGLARTGHARRVDGGWKVARETWCRLVGMVGVQCPPRGA